jgi:hypothetical protein
MTFRAVGAYSLVAAFYAVSTLLLTFPIIGKVGDHLFGGGDSYFLPWVLAWVFHHFSLSPSKLFNANIFYPAPDSLAFSENHLSAQLLYAPLYLLSGNPVLSYNLVLLLSYVCLGLSMFALVRYLTGDLVAAVIAGFIFAFSPVRLFPYPHLQLMLMWWSPLALLFLERHLRRPSWRDFTLFCAAFWLQFLSSTYLGLYLATMALLRVCWAAFVSRDLILGRELLTKLLCLGVGSMIVLGPFVLPYVRVSQQWGYTRTLAENIASSAELTSYFSAGPNNYLYGHLLSGFPYFSWPKFLFPGFVPLALALLGAWGACRGRIPEAWPSTAIGRAYVLLGATALLLSLGPVLIWRGHVTGIPLPYMILYDFVPGYRAMRVPARFGLWVGLAIAILAGDACCQLRRVIRGRFGHRRGLSALHGSAVAIVIALVGLEAYTPVHPLAVPVNEHVPAVYRFLANEDGSPLIELPMPKTHGPDAVHWREMERTYFSIYHGRRMVNGYSGFTPPSFDEIARLVSAGPQPRVIRALADLGVRTIVLHMAEMSDTERKAWRVHNPEVLGLRERARFHDDIVLKITGSARLETGLTAELDLPRILPLRGASGIGLLLRSASKEPWVDRPLRRWLDIEVRWRDASGCDSARSHSSVAIPIVVLREEPICLNVPAPTPIRAGAYRVTVSSRLFSASRRVIVREVFPQAAEPMARAKHEGRVLAATAACDRMRNGGSAS